MDSIGRPNDVRGFLHKKTFNFVKGAFGAVANTALGFIPGGNVAQGIASTVFGGGPRQLHPAVPGAFNPPQMPCKPGFGITKKGKCVRIGGKFDEFIISSQFAGNGTQVIPGGFPGRPEDIVSPSPGFGRPPGEAVNGRYGPAEQPSGEMIHHRSCDRGMVLGNDGLCYPRRQLANKEREWPRGRRPLLTGGDMRAIQTASTAAKKLQAKQKQLQGLGLLKKPMARRAPTRQMAHLTAAERHTRDD